MLILLVACTDSKESISDSQVIVDSVDSTDSSPEEPQVTAGPDCVTEDLPITTPFNVLGAYLVAGMATEAMQADLQAVIADVAEVPGPWAHEVLGPYLAEDGLNFDLEANSVLTSASVPELVVGLDGRTWLFYVNGDLNALSAAAAAQIPVGPGLTGFGGLGASVSEDGVHFSPVAIEIQGDLPLYVVDPDIIRRADGSYQLYYLGIPASEMCADTPDPSVVPGPHQVYMATSSDLIHWEQQGVAFTTTVGGTDPAVWCVDDMNCYIYMDEAGVSTDGGRTFSPTAAVQLDPNTMLPDVHATTNGFRMYSWHGALLNSDVSNNGENWQIEGELGVPSGSPTAQEINGITWLYVIQTMRTP